MSAVVSAPAAATRLSLVGEAAAFGAARCIVYPDDTEPAWTLGPWTRGKFAGAPAPEWVEAAAYIGGVNVQATGPASLWPKFGAVADARGRVFASTFGEALSSGRTLADLDAAPPTEEIGPAAVYLPFGAQFNYGHMLLDGLTSLQALLDAGLMGGRVAVSDRLTGWRRDLMEFAFPEIARHETEAWRIAARSVAFADSMDHYLHRPGPAALRLRERLLRQAPEAAGTPERIYVSRRGSAMRLLTNEAALERALAARGFAIVRPEALPVSRQIALFRGARVILGATGAGLANALVARGCVIEILPTNFSAPWVRDLCFRVGCEWRGWFAPAPLPAWRAGRHRRRQGFRFAWTLRLSPFLRWLDGELREFG